MSTIASYGDRRSMERLLSAYGELRTFTRWTKTKDRKKASQAWGPDSTIDPIEAKAAFVNVTESRDRGVSRGDQLLAVAGAPFVKAGVELTDEWRMTMMDGTTRKVSGPVESPASSAVFTVMLKTGGGEVGGT